MESHPHLRHQGSLESVLDLFPSILSLSSAERVDAVSAFTKIIAYYNSSEESLPGPKRSYKRGKLLQLVYENAVPGGGQDKVLRYFLTVIAAPLIDRNQSTAATDQEFSHALAGLVMFEDKSQQEKFQAAQKVQELADHLVDYFFLPCRFIKASVPTIADVFIVKGLSAKTPQPTPHLSAPLEHENSTVVGTIRRISNLRMQCLVRDRYRCVISRVFDHTEAERRFTEHGDDARDDDDQLLADEDTGFLEVAHIIPHALTSSDNPSHELVCPPPPLSNRYKIAY
jgi:hypothetical protein